MDFPKEFKYTKDHEWIKIDGNEATIGITEFAQSELGDIVYVDISAVGSEIGQDEVFGTVEAVKTVSELFMPVAGTIAEINGALNDNPEFVNTDPYGKGWMVKISVTDQEAMDELLSADSYKTLVGA